MSKILIKKVRIYNNIIIIVENFKNENEKKKEETKKKYAKKNLETEKRHENNVIKLNIEREKLAKETEEKEFKKYISFYFLRKAQENALKQKRKEKKTKIKEKNERMEELERLNKERENNLIKKMMKKEAIKEKYDKIRKERFSMDKTKREEKLKKCQTQKIELMKEQNERRLDILDIQLDLLKRGKKKEKSYELKRITAGERRVLSQMNMEKNLSDFYKRMNALKNQSIYKKTEEERYKMYRDLKRVFFIKIKLNFSLNKNNFKLFVNINISPFLSVIDIIFSAFSSEGKLYIVSIDKSFLFVCS